DIHTFGAPVDSFVAGQVVVRGNFIAALATWRVLGTPQSHELVLLERSGRRRYVKRLDETELQPAVLRIVNDVPLRLGESRDLAVSTFPWSTMTKALMVAADGDERSIGDASPIADPTRAGDLPVVHRLRADDNAYSLGWIRASELAITDVAVPHVVE